MIGPHLRAPASWPGRCRNRAQESDAFVCPPREKHTFIFKLLLSTHWGVPAPVKTHASSPFTPLPRLLCVKFLRLSLLQRSLLGRPRCRRAPFDADRILRPEQFHAPAVGSRQARTNRFAEQFPVPEFARFLEGGERAVVEIQLQGQRVAFAVPRHPEPPPQPTALLERPPSSS